MKKTKIILLVMLGTCFIGFLPATLGAANVRPISDFTDTNDNIAAWVDGESGIIMFPHGWFIYGFPSGPQSIADCSAVSGSVLEKELKDGQMMYKVNLHVKGALMVVANNTDGTVFLVGEMEYLLQVNMLVYEGELGDPVPNLLQIWFPEFFLPGEDPIGEGTFSHLTGKGTGIMQVDALGFTAGDSVNVKINQVGLTKPEGHPFYPEMWAEILVFH